MTARSREEIYETIRGYIQEEFLEDSDVTELEEDTPLLEWGVLNSMNTAVLLAFIRTELGVAVPPTHITGRHFHSIGSVTDLVHGLVAQPA